MDFLDTVKGAVPTLLGGIPVIGLILESLLVGAESGGRRQILERRLTEFLEDLREEFARPLREDFPEQYLQSQDYAHLILLAFDHAVRTRQRNKRRLYA